MSAICPAGPPKLMKPSLNQKAKAWRKLTVGGGGSVAEGRAVPDGEGELGGVMQSGEVVCECPQGGSVPLRQPAQADGVPHCPRHAHGLPGLAYTVGHDHTHRLFH